MRLVLQTANVVSDAKNCLYPNRVEAGNAAELQEAIKKDHVCGEYKKNYRSKENFIRSNVAVMDCDNDHSEDPEEWEQNERTLRHDRQPDQLRRNPGRDQQSFEGILFRNRRSSPGKA